jgi:hypothetical protein
MRALTFDRVHCHGHSLIPVTAKQYTLTSEGPRRDRTVSFGEASETDHR